MINNFTLQEKGNNSCCQPVQKQAAPAERNPANIIFFDDTHDVKKNNASFFLIHTLSSSESQSAVLPKLKTFIMKTFLSKYRVFAIALLIANFFLLSGAFAANRFSVATGNWSSTATWSATSGGAPGASVPDGNDVVVIEGGFTVTVTVAAAANTVTISSTSILIVNANLTVQKKGSTIGFITVNGTISFNSTAIVTSTGSGGDVEPFTLSSGGTIKTANTSGFTGATGSIRVTGTITLSTSANYEFTGTATQGTVGLPATVNNLTANNTVGVTLSSSVTVNGIFLVTNTGTVDVTGGTTTLGGSATMTIDPQATFQVSSGGTATFGARPVTIKSTTAGTGRIGTITGTFNAATNVTSERFIPQRPGLGRAYRFLASTVNTTTPSPTSMRFNWMENGLVTTVGGTSDPVPGYGTHITGSGGNANDFDVTQNNQSSVYTATNGGTSATLVYTAVANASGTLSATQGIFLYVRGNRSESLSIPNVAGASTSATTLRATGTLLTGPQTSFGTMVGGAGSLNVVTNPYESPIDWSLVQPACTNIGTSYTLWDPRNGTRGGFVTVNLAGTPSSGSANQFIQPGQAFFVESSGGVPTISIQEGHKAAGNNNLVFRPGTLSESFRTELYFTEQPSGYRRLADGVIALYDNAYTAGIDINDASEINNWDENIAIARAGKHLAIESRPIIITKDTLPLFMNNMRQMAYEFEFTPSAFTNAGLKAELIDNFLGSRTVLSVTATTVVSFTVTSDPASSATDRFMVVFGPQVPLAVDLITVRAYKNNNGVQVDWTSRTETGMDHYEVERSANGINFGMKTNVAAIGNSSGAVNYTWFDANPQMGNNFYRIKGLDQAGNFKYSQEVKVLFGKDAPGIVAYPNPVVGNSFSVDLNNIEKGSYRLSLVNNLGQEVYSEAVIHDGGSVMKTITMKETLPQGNYQLVLKGENGIKLTQKIIKN
jgi:hypothetical protein